jgi:hypothetical protein
VHDVVLVVQVKIKQNYVPDRAPNGKMLNRPKEMHAVSTEVWLRLFSSSLPVCPVLFYLVTARHVYGPCSASFETC